MPLFDRESQKVSVCVPTYNGANFLEDCLRSIQSQSYRNLEILVVDDRSSDETNDIVSRFAADDDRFRVLQNEVRLGLVGNWNRCLEKATGDWIKFVFQDDLIEPACVATLVRKCQSSGCLFGFCHRHLLFEERTRKVTIEYLSEQQLEIAQVFGVRESFAAGEFADICAKEIVWNPIGEPTVTLFHRSLIPMYGIFNPTMIQICDAEFWMRLGTNVGVAHVPEMLATFRVHEKSATTANLNDDTLRLRLDPLILTYLWLSRGHYKTMRKALYRAYGAPKVWLDLVREATRAKRQTNHPGDAKLRRGIARNSWSEVINQYPTLEMMARIGFIFGVILRCWNFLRLKASEAQGTRHAS